MLQLLGFVCVAQLTLAVLINPSTDQVGRSAAARPYAVPEASLPCSPEEQAWWKELRDAAEDVRPMGRQVDKQKKKFASVLHEAAAKSYNPPIPDTRPIFLHRTEPQYTEGARRRNISGTVILQVELLSEGSVGTVKVLKGLSAGLNENAIDAARQTVFLPAVKNRKFVTVSIRVEMTFSLTI